MAADRVLSQEEIDSVFRNLREPSADDDPSRRAIVYDFSRPDRIAKDQLRAIHLLHDNFTRSLASSLSAYLRAYVIVNLVSVEQLSFMEFSQTLPSPTCLVSMSMKPFDGNAVLELNPQVVFPILEMLLGGVGKPVGKVTREITEIEQVILDGLFRIVLQDLESAWRTITNIEFKVESHETEPQLLQIMAPNEAVVSLGIEIRIGETSGMMNIGVPSLIIKMLRQRFDQQWTMRKSESTVAENNRMFRLVKPSELRFDARLSGPHLTVEDLMGLEVGDVLEFDFPVNRPLDLLVNGSIKYHGHVVDNGRKKAFHIGEISAPA
ncbi:MAG TPA: flagellar motor switch protein FliM [Solibacterales bacterium]|nr:flagellar motor switch protein FliM [Bryobacterales bacterium]